ncbi:hypothetical protein diail_7383 [Diaporthe ilicicola]|nr:hypothetical protein diail_7383 [Diaporthe ilicicola]
MTSRPGRSTTRKKLRWATAKKEQMRSEPPASAPGDDAEGRRDRRKRAKGAAAAAAAKRKEDEAKEAAAAAAEQEEQDKAQGADEPEAANPIDIEPASIEDITAQQQQAKIREITPRDLAGYIPSIKEKLKWDPEDKIYYIISCARKLDINVSDIIYCDRYTRWQYTGCIIVPGTDTTRREYFCHICRPGSYAELITALKNGVTVRPGWRKGPSPPRDTHRRLNSPTPILPTILEALGPKYSKRPE